MRDLNKKRISDLRAVKKWMNNNLSKGLCLRCTNQRIKTSNLYCEKHYFQTVSKSVFGVVGQWEILKLILENQEYRCAMTGDILILGVNDSLDHIMPKSRIINYNDISNLRWVTRQFNTVKNNLTDTELIKLLEKIKSFALSRKRDSLECALALKSNNQIYQPNT